MGCHLQKRARVENPKLCSTDRESNGKENWKSKRNWVIIGIGRDYVPKPGGRGRRGVAKVNTVGSNCHI